MVSDQDIAPNPGRVTEWCATVGISLAEPLLVSLISGGRSNLTFRIVDNAGKAYVLRRPPLGPVFGGAHHLQRESVVVTALEGTGIPAPRILGFCSDESVIGAPFYLMEYVPGVVVATHEDGRALAESVRTKASEQAIDVLAQIHLLDVDSVGLGTLGRRDDYLSRQLHIWHRQSHKAATRELPLIDELHRRLAASAPPQRYTSLVHGDYRLGNLLLASDGTVNAVLDWELCSLGDPMADLGWILATWRQPGETEIYQSPSGHRGFLSRDQLIHRYQASTGRDVSDPAYYVAFALWRLACIYEGIYARYKNGAMGDDGVEIEAQGRIAVSLAEAAWQALPTYTSD